MYRPKDWKNPYDGEGHVRLFGHDASDVARIAFNAGADAMLEKLKDSGVFAYGHHTPDIDLNDAPEVSGYWVFIPDEEKGNG